MSRWVAPALAQDVIWCQLFSEPDAGSDAAGIKTKGTRVDGGWLVNGQKVWTSGAKESSFGLATIRTNPDVPKHQGITTMVIDMKSKGVEVRPLKQATGDSHFNEVFFNDVFVPDDDVIGPVDNGWTVARATLGNESVSIGGGGGGGATPDKMIISLVDEHPDRLRGGVPRVGTFLANSQAMAMLNLRTVFRAVEGSGPGPEGAMTKLVLSEQGHEATAILSELAGQDLAFMEGVGARRRPDGALAPRPVDRRWHVGDQAQPDRRAHPRPAARPADQVARPSPGCSRPGQPKFIAPGMPPSTTIVWPVIVSARHSSTVASAMSTALPTLPSTAWRRAPSATASGRRCAIRVPSTRPGATQFTDTAGAIATARQWVRWIRPAFEHE